LPQQLLGRERDPCALLLTAERSGGPPLGITKRRHADRDGTHYSSPALFHFRPKIRLQRIHIGEPVGYLALADMLVVSLARLIVEAQHTTLIGDVGEAVLVRMRARTRRPRHPPDHDLHERAATEN